MITARVANVIMTVFYYTCLYNIRLIIKIKKMRETLTLSTCEDNSIVSKKLSKIFGSKLERLPILKALCRTHPEQNVGPIHESKSEHLLFLVLHAGTMHSSNLEHLLVFKAICGDNPQVQSGTHPFFKGSMRGQSTWGVKGGGGVNQ